MATRPILRIERKTFKNGATFIVARSNLPRQVKWYHHTGSLMTLSGHVDGWAKSSFRTDEEYAEDLRVIAEAKPLILGHLSFDGHRGPRGCCLRRFRATPRGLKHPIAKEMDGKLFRNVMRGETQVKRTTTSHKWGWGDYMSQAVALEEAEPIDHT